MTHQTQKQGDAQASSTAKPECQAVKKLWAVEKMDFSAQIEHLQEVARTAKKLTPFVSREVSRIEAAIAILAALQSDASAIFARLEDAIMSASPTDAFESDQVCLVCGEDFRVTTQRGLCEECHAEIIAYMTATSFNGTPNQGENHE